MNLKKMEFNGHYDKADFYARTGMFFAEKQYRKEMPYLINTDTKEWCLFYDGENLAGFYAHEPKDSSIAISGFYVVEEYRKKGVSEFMLEDILSHYTSVRMVTSSQHLLKLLTFHHFVRISRRGSYLTMAWRREDKPDA